MTWQELVLKLSSEYTIFGYITGMISLITAVVFGRIKYLKDREDLIGKKLDNDSKYMDNERKRIELDKLRES